jgi:hypothetical protein
MNNELFDEFVAAVRKEILAEYQKIDAAIYTMESFNGSGLPSNLRNKQIGLAIANEILIKHYKQMKGEDE